MKCHMNNALKFLAISATVLVTIGLIWLSAKGSRSDKKDSLLERVYFCGIVRDAIVLYSMERDGQLPLDLIQLIPKYLVSSNGTWIRNRTAVSDIHGWSEISASKSRDITNRFMYFGAIGKTNNLILSENYHNLGFKDLNKQIVVIGSNFTVNLRTIVEVKSIVELNASTIAPVMP